MRLKPIHLLMIAPVLIMLVLVIGLPSLNVFWLSFHEKGFGSEATFVGLGNYITILTDPKFYTALVNTFVIVNFVVYFELALALGMASLFASGMPFRKLTTSIILVPYAASTVIAVVVWKYIFDADIGYFTQLLQLFGIHDFVWNNNRWAALGVVALLSVWLHLPFSFLILFSARMGLPTDLYEAAKIDRATNWDCFRKITLPLMMPAIMVALMFRYVFAFRLFGEVWLLTGGGPARQTEVMAIYLYKSAFTYQAFGMGAAVGWLMVIATMVMAAAYLTSMYKKMLAYDA